MRGFCIRGLWLLMVLAWLAPGPGRAATETATGEEALRRGVELYRAGQSEEALSRLRGFVIRHSTSPLLPEAYLYLARIFQDAGQDEEALLYLGRIPEERRTPEVRLIEGAALVGSGEPGRGVEILQGLENQSLTEADRRLRLQALAEGNAAQGRPLPALFFLHRLLALPGAAQESVLQQAHVLLRDRLDDAELAEAGFMFDGTPIGEDARLQQALRAFSAGDNLLARQLAAGVVRSTVPFPYRRDAVLLLERLSGDRGPERSVGVILPLSGKYAAFGELVRRGMELAQQVHSELAVRFLFLDTDADPERSAEAVSELAHGERVIAIAGPLTGGAAAAAAARAQQEKVPLLTLSQREGLAESGEWVFRNSLTSRLQAQALARYAVEEQGLRTFGILFPDNRLGREMAELFTLEVARLGAEVVGVQSYADNATDFRQQVDALLGKRPQSDQEKAPAAEAEAALPPPFEALFVPDYADRIGLIAPQLVYYGIEGVQLLGINGWNSPDLLRSAGPYVEGAVFPDGFFRYSPYPFVREFVNLYFERYGEEPSILEAQGFDIAGILLHLLADPAVQTREDLRLSLSRLSNYPGVTGATSFNLQGDAEKILFLLQVQDGDIVQIN